MNQVDSRIRRIETLHDKNGNDIWWKSGCMKCEYVAHGPSPELLCPNDGSPLLIMEGLIVADDIITVARLMVKSDSEHRQGEQLAIAARADLNRVNDLIYKRINDQRIVP